jgi:chorismate lyase / 3-hydroxybenzoate synthase
VYWLAGREAGIALENPRQLAAYHYPRQYGPTPPAFSRAMLVAPDLLMISGTASIVGHASRHAGSIQGQTEEIFSNLDSLLARARAHAPALPGHFNGSTLIKAYLRNRDDLSFVLQALGEKLPAGTSLLVLAGDVCRSDLLLELDCLHAAG